MNDAQQLQSSIGRPWDLDDKGIQSGDIIEGAVSNSEMHFDDFEYLKTVSFLLFSKARIDQFYYDCLCETLCNVLSEFVVIIEKLSVSVSDVTDEWLMCDIYNTCKNIRMWAILLHSPSCTG